MFVFLDTSALIAAVFSESGGARMILKLGEAGAVRLVAGPSVLREIDEVLMRKSPSSKPRLALLLDRAGITAGQGASAETMAAGLKVTQYEPDARILGEALMAGVQYLVTFDREHLLGNPKRDQLPFPLGTPGDFLIWIKGQLEQAPSG